MVYRPLISVLFSRYTSSPVRRTLAPLAGLPAAGLILLSLAYLVVRPVFLDVGGPYDGGQVEGFYRREVAPDGAAYRWSSGHSRIVFPGYGSGPATVILQMSASRPVGEPPLPVEIVVNGAPPLTLQLERDTHAYEIAVPGGFPPALSGDLTLEFRSPTFFAPEDRRALGFIVDFVRVVPQGPTWPAPAHLVYLLTSVALWYALLRRLGWRTWVAVGTAGGLLLGMAGLLATLRMALTVFSLPLLALLVLAHIALWGVQWATRAAAGWALGDRLWPATHPGWRLLFSLFTAALLLKVGGLLHPYTFVVDAEFHLRMIGWLFTGEFPDQHTLAFLVMPADEWKQRAFIPYSPFFYYVFAPLTALPWPTTVTVPVVAALLDALRTPLVFLLALRLGPGQWRALAAAAVFTFIPATFVTQQFGNWPTQISLWLTLAWLTAAALTWERLHRPLPFVIAGGLLGLALLSYTVTAGYIGIIFGGFVLAGLLFARGQRRTFAALGGVGLLGIAIALAGFYGAYMVEFVTESIPTLLGATGDTSAGAGGSVTTREGGLLGFLENSVLKAVQSYGLAMVFSLGLAGFGLALAEWWQRRRGAAAGIGTLPARAPWAFGLLTAWVISLPLFTAADYVVDQAFKEYWFALPAQAILAGAWLRAVARRGRAGALWTTLLGVLLVWSSLSLWVFRLLLHNR